MPTVDKRTLLLGSFASVAALGLSGRGGAAAARSADRAKSAEPTAAPLDLMSPPAAQTADSIVVLWNKLTAFAVEGYDVFLDGKLVATTKFTDYSFHGLQPGKIYEISVRARLAGADALSSGIVRVATRPRPKIYDVRMFGAIGDGKTLNTAAIQKAIDTCAPGGSVRIPAGVFVSGALYLKSDMTLHLDKGAVLMGSSDARDYPVMTYRSEGKEKPCYSSLIGTRDVKGERWRNIAITGSGTINGNGSILRQNQLAKKAAERGRVICIRDTDGLYLQGITVRQSPFWCIHPIYCNGVTINGISIHTKYDEAGNKYPHMVNGDGLDPDSCRDVFIFDCDISSQDDGIALKSGRDAEGRAVGIPTENVRISHCRFHSGFGVAMGSEMAGGIRNVLVEDCVFENTFSIASVKAPRGRGNYIENVTYRDCTLKYESDEHRDGTWFRGALYIDQFYGIPEPDPHAAEPKDEGTARISDISFQNIRFENVTARGTHGFIAYNVLNLAMDSLSIEARDGKAMDFVNVRS